MYAEKFYQLKSSYWVISYQLYSCIKYTCVINMGTMLGFSHQLYTCIKYKGVIDMGNNLKRIKPLNTGEAYWVFSYQLYTYIKYTGVINLDNHLKRIKPFTTGELYWLLVIKYMHVSNTQVLPIRVIMSKE